MHIESDIRIKYNLFLQEFSMDLRGRNRRCVPFYLVDIASGVLEGTSSVTDEMDGLRSFQNRVQVILLLLKALRPESGKMVAESIAVWLAGPLPAVARSY
jgi:hypothetical protein